MFRSDAYLGLVHNHAVQVEKYVISLSSGIFALLTLNTLVLSFNLLH
jgi:hypothetical protein